METITANKVLTELQGLYPNLGGNTALIERVKAEIQSALPELQRKVGTVNYAYVLQGIMSVAQQNVG